MRKSEDRRRCYITNYKRCNADDVGQRISIITNFFAFLKMKVGQSDKQRVLSTYSLYNAFNLALQSSNFFTYCHLAIQTKVKRR